MVITIGVTAASRRWSQLLAVVEGGGEVVITRYGRPMARLLPVAEPKRSRAEVLEAMAAAGQGASLGGTTIRELIDEGRKY